VNSHDALVDTRVHGQQVREESASLDNSARRGMLRELFVASRLPLMSGDDRRRSTAAVRVSRALMVVI
jgi:hypothetical protein